MARGRHRRRREWFGRLRFGRLRFGWLRFGWLRFGWLGPHRGAAYAPPQDRAELGLRAQVALLDAEVSRLRVLGEQHAAAAAAAERAAVLAQQQLGAARCELAALRTDLAALREELVWAFAARELSASTPGTLTVLPGTAGRAASAGTG